MMIVFPARLVLPGLMARGLLRSWRLRKAPGVARVSGVTLEVGAMLGTQGQLFLAELARCVPASVAVVNGANPRLCRGTGLSQDLSSAVAVVTRVAGHIMDG